MIDQKALETTQAKLRRDCFAPELIERIIRLYETERDKKDA